MDYSTLKTTLAAYLHRDDLTANIPTFILFAQKRMSRDLDTNVLHKTDSLAVTAATREVALPDDCLELMSVRIPYSGGYKLVQQQSLFGNSQTLEAYGGSSSSPYNYARYGNYMELTPTPEETTTLEIVYKSSLAELSADADTDVILTDYPQIYIYAAMIEATPFIVDDARIDTWGNLYREEIKTINDLSYRSEWSGSPLQIKNLGVDTP